MSEIICLDDSDDELLAASRLSFSNRRNSNIGRTANNNDSSITSTIGHVGGNGIVASTLVGVDNHGTNRSTTGGASRPKKKSKPMKPHCLIWVCPHGVGQSRKWRKKDLKIVGVYPSKADAEKAKKDLMNEHEGGGHGDIIVGGSDEDEISLVVREAPMYF